MSIVRMNDEEDQHEDRREDQQDENVRGRFERVALSIRRLGAT